MKYLAILNPICKFCNKKVGRNSVDGFMETKTGLYHFKCVDRYGYQKFCKEIDEKEKIDTAEINKRLEKSL